MNLIIVNPDIDVLSFGLCLVLILNLDLGEWEILNTTKSKKNLLKEIFEINTKTFDKAWYRGFLS